MEEVLEERVAMLLLVPGVFVNRCLSKRMSCVIRRQSEELCVWIG
jgi:hypothetical protein